MPLTWTEPEPPDGAIMYTHVKSATPLGLLVIEWKGWKESSSPTCVLPWGEFVLGITLDDCKTNVQTAWNKMAAAVAALSS